jgi:flagella basal body P-ring formation protein FlgA
MRHVTKIAVLSILVMVASVLTVSARVDDATIIDKVRQTYDLDSVDYQIEILSNTMRDIDGSNGILTFRALSQKDPIGLFTILAKETDGDRKIASGQVRLRISRFMDVVVVNDKIKRHAVLTDDLFAVKRMDVTTLREQPITSINDVLGLRAKRNLKLGQILTSQAVELIPDVEPGREVAIVYTNGLCRISATGVVMQEGMAGDYIKVKNKSSGKMVIARVVDHGAVVVDL